MPVIDEIKNLLEDLTGKIATQLISKDISSLDPFSDRHGLGYSQFNELLLLFGFNRVSHSFFQFLVDGSIDFQENPNISSLDQLKEGVENFQRVAIFYFGSIKNAYKILSRDVIKLRYYLYETQEISIETYQKRNKAILPIEPIPANKTYYLGYIIQREIRNKLDSDPGNAELKKIQSEIEDIISKAKINHEAYLTSDHLDVYVATSMRENHEFLYVNKIADKIFNKSELKDLNLRWFDPTQAYCIDRIDKGLSEALMLKRAKCTIYLAQESDTLGKDSELATTLAQGKPVIAFVPDVDEKYVDELIKDISIIKPGKDNKSILLEILKLSDPKLAWTDEDLKNWLKYPDKVDEKLLKHKVEENLRIRYNSRANILKDQHPLGIQVNLATGVANGLLVVRRIKDCIEIIKRILTRKLDFELESQTINGNKYIFLKEKVSNCVYRIVSGDELLTNSFWNFYLENNPNEYQSKYQNTNQ